MCATDERGERSSPTQLFKGFPKITKKDLLQKTFNILKLRGIPVTSTCFLKVMQIPMQTDFQIAIGS